MDRNGGYLKDVVESIVYLSGICFLLWSRYLEESNKLEFSQSYIWSVDFSWAFDWILQFVVTF